MPSLAAGLLPRHVAYYEVLIQGYQNQTDNHNINYNNALALTPYSECIAVGLATQDFCSEKRLPGWDENSFGYHSDDGGIFHGGGHRLAVYGPGFGVGDVVGCGFNYHSGSIFFTLNGQHLGDAFTVTTANCSLSLYPTVGVDAHVQISFNFGLEPFRFRLYDYMKSQ